MPHNHAAVESSLHPEVEDQAQDIKPDRQFERQFGKHVRGLRQSRGLTQEFLAEAAGIASDTIRRLEYGDFSPSLRTLRGVCAGFGIELSTLFTGFELRERCVDQELMDLLSELTADEQDALIRFVYALRRVARSR
jgi:transcriptional regulator with XRE-family HTH domain